MADNTPIEWTDATWNPITGCSIVSAGCTNCYAMKLAGTRLKNHPSRKGLTSPSKAGPVWNGQVRINREWLDQPLKWKRPRMIFVCAHGDLFAEGVPDNWIDQVFAVMALAPQHIFQVLTKRPERMRDYVSALNERGRHSAMEYAALMAMTGCWNTPALNLKTWPLPNVWLGVSVEDQKSADARIPILLQTPAAIRWISAEPLLGQINIRQWMSAFWEGLTSSYQDSDGLIRSDITGNVIDGLDWVVAGGESGPGARPMHPDWARSLLNQCADASVPFLFKQWGAWAPADHFDSETQESYDLQGLTSGASIRIGKKAAGRLLDGVEHNGLPEVR